MHSRRRKEKLGWNRAIKNGHLQIHRSYQENRNILREHLKAIIVS